MPKLNYANVVATCALFLSLTGGAYAAVAVTGKNVKDGTLTSVDVKNRSLLAQDFKAGQLPAGPQGVPGAAGPQGPKGEAGANGADGKNGATHVVVRRADGPVPAGKTTVLAAECAAGERVTGGGFNTGSHQVYATQSAPSTDGGLNAALTAGATPNAWRVQLYNAGGYTNGVVYVVCAAP